MKKFTLSITAALLLNLHSKAQVFPYPSIYSDFTLNYTLSDGIHTQVTPGLLWAGSQNQVVTGGNFTNWVNANFFIRGYGQSSFWAVYKVFQGNSLNCNGAPVQMNNTTGVSFIETQTNANQMRYALAGATSDGAFYTALNSGGVPILSRWYPFSTYLSNQPGPSKPVIVEDYNSGDFYIAGSVGGEIYLLKINASGNVIWSRNFNLNFTAYFSDMILCPNQSNRLMLVGSYDAAVNDKDAFLLEVNSQTGSLNSLQSFGSTGFNDEFRAIKPSVSNGTGPGYLLAGMSNNSNNGLPQPWLTKLSLGGGAIWSQMYQPVNGSNNGFVDLVERRNSQQNYEIYGLVDASAGMVVLKLDDNGLPFPLNNASPNNEFLYNIPGNGNSRATCLSMIAGNNPDPGLQVYGTAYNISTGNTSHVAWAYFNGVTNCMFNLTQMNQPTKAQYDIQNIPVFMINGLEECSNIVVSAFFLGGAMNFPCSGYIASGNNARTSGATGIAMQEEDNQNLNVFPNPATSELTVEYYAASGNPATISLTDLAGREIYTTTQNQEWSGNQSLVLDLHAMQLSAGLYLVEVSSQSGTFQKKISVTSRAD